MLHPQCYPLTEVNRGCYKHRGELATMAIHPELLEILACPACKTPVALVKNDTALKCDQCYRVYPIRDDIPIMLIDEATIEPPETKSSP